MPNVFHRTFTRETPGLEGFSVSSFAAALVLDDFFSSQVGFTPPLYRLPLQSFKRGCFSSCFVSFFHSRDASRFIQEFFFL